MTRCITCKKPTNRNRAHMVIHFEKEEYLVCCPLCQTTFEQDPHKYIDRKKHKHS